MLKIIIFGVGKAFWDSKDFFIWNSDVIDVVAFIDNDARFHDRRVCNIPIYAPEMIQNLDFDGIVILSKKFYEEMARQLTRLGISRAQIWDLSYIKYQILKGKKVLFGKDICNVPEKEKILIISTNMGTSGGTRVAIYAAQALRLMGKEVMLASPEISFEAFREVMNANLPVTVWAALPYIYEEDKEWINKFDVIIVNVFQMMNCAYEISKVKPVLWWIHEVKSVWTSYFEDTRKKFPDINTVNWMNRLNVVGVSEISAMSFNYFYPGMMNRIMPFGISDKHFIDKGKREKNIFAVTADFAEIKGQHILVDALNMLNDNEKKQVEVWFIGPKGKSLEDLRQICGDGYSVEFPGALLHEEVIDLVSDIDVLVCPSMIESMSMSTIEGMMLSKICIASDMTGIAKYIEDGKNGFVFKVGDAADLAVKISWIINNRNRWKTIQEAARQTFEEKFSMKKFAENLIVEIEQAKRIYEGSRR